MISLDVVLVVVVVGKGSATEGADIERNEEDGTSGPDEDVVQADASCEESKHAMARKTRLFVRRGNPHIQEGGVSRV